MLIAINSDIVHFHSPSCPFREIIKFKPILTARKEPSHSKVENKEMKLMKLWAIPQGEAIVNTESVE